MSADGLRDKKLIKFAVEEHPACGTPQEALSFHRLDSKSLVERVSRAIREIKV
jgi:hypothetical protein